MYFALAACKSKHKHIFIKIMRVSRSTFAPEKKFCGALSGEHFLEQTAFAGDSVSQNTFTRKVFRKTLSPARYIDCQCRKKKVLLFFVFGMRNILQEPNTLRESKIDSKLFAKTSQKNPKQVAKLIALLLT